ncbi:MAG: Excinuclease subunit domain protein [Herbinix sp.]|jgi:excinuclease ABC subunit C|nr:Excinuclease subunit domain protein [Herbinix sp.]
MNDKITNKLNQLPALPGIYKMLDTKGKIIYIGKSKCLKIRVKSYFTGTPKWEKIKKLVSLIDDFDITITDTHLEARLLECELIKEYRPVFNSQMKHDQGYVYLKVEDYNVHNSLSVVNERSENTYGPFRRRYALNEFTLSLKSLYPIKKSGKHYAFDYLLFPIALNRDTYQENQRILTELLSNDDNISLFIQDLELKMKEAASMYKFETASKFRDLINGMTFIKHGINGYKDLLCKEILLQIPIQSGYKLFYISQGNIRHSEKYSSISEICINHFINCTSMLPPFLAPPMEEKAAIDFRDILYSEIMSLPAEMVLFLD